MSAHPIPSSVTIGGVTKPELLALLDAAGVNLNAMAVRLFDDARFESMPKQGVLRIREISVASLGLAEGATIAQILARAAERGMRPGPLELGPHLRLQYRDQPEGNTGADVVRHCAPSGAVTIASIPISDDDDFPCGFYLRKIDGALWLRGYQSWAGHVWNAEDRFVFVVPASCSEP